MLRAVIRREGDKIWEHVTNSEEPSYVVWTGHYLKMKYKYKYKHNYKQKYSYKFWGSKLCLGTPLLAQIFEEGIQNSWKNVDQLITSFAK